MMQTYSNGYGIWNKMIVDSIVSEICVCHSTWLYCVQSQKAVSAYFTSKQILPFGFAEYYTAPDSQAAVTAYFSREPLPLFARQYLKCRDWR